MQRVMSELEIVMDVLGKDDTNVTDMDHILQRGRKLGKTTAKKPAEKRWRRKHEVISETFTKKTQ